MDMKSDHLRPGQRLIVYASLVENRHEKPHPDPFELWLWNLSEKEFKKVMEWRIE